MVQEDGIVEYASAFALLFLSLWLIATALKHRKEKSTLWFMAQVGMGLVFFFGFGEEISWGQRIFNVESSQYFLENNTQQETNLHNLVVNGTDVNKVIFATGLVIAISAYFLFSNLLYNRVIWFKKIVHQFSIPLPKLVHVLIILVFTIFMLLFEARKQWEAWELSFVAILLWLFVDYRKLIYAKR